MTKARPVVVQAHAFAKINLTLRVLGVRADGYHELRTMFQSLALHDTLSFERVRGPFAIACSDPRCPTDQTNLVWKAAAALWREAGRDGEPSGVRVRLQKRIPQEAGLGGGSSDGAATLRALSALWRLRVDDGTLAQIASTLGADVPFFLHGGTALGVERGDLLFALEDAAPAWVVLARPDFGVSTGEAYGWWDQAHQRRGADVGGPRPRGRGPRTAVSGPGTEWVNDLQAPVVARHPRILRLIGQLERRGARYAAMSGSGSAVFGLFDEVEPARAAAASLAGAKVATWLTRTTLRRAFQRGSAVRGLSG
jgi:4-diphosphocytidyl-2-C-methyl-D-erythritol kinase